MKIYIIRHGETDANKFGIFQGQTDLPLNEFGISLAEATGEGLKGISFDAAFTSPLTRAEQTAQLILSHSGNDGCPLYYDDRLLEISLGDYEGKSFLPENGQVRREDLVSFFSDPVGLPPFPNGESVTDVMERTQAFLHELVGKDYGCVLVSTHGCALRCMLQEIYNESDNFWHGHVPYNCVINVVETDGDKMRLTEDDRVYYDEALCVDRFAIG